MPPKIEENHKPKERILFFAALLLGTGAATVWVLNDYISIIALSLIFAITVHPLYLFLKERFKLHAGVASLMTIIISFFLIIMPIILSINLFIQEIGGIIADGLINTDTIVGLLERHVLQLNTFLASLPLVNLQINASNLDRVLFDITTNMSKYLLDQAVAIGTSGVRFIVNFFIFLILLYFAIPSLPNLKQYLLRVSPLGDKIDALYINRLEALIVSMIKSIFIVAFAQGLVGALFLWIADVDYILTLTVLMIIMSMIPVFGTGVVTVPIALYLLLTGNIAGGVIILLGQLIFISNIDNVLRAELLSRETSLHPAVMLMGVFGGIQVFGGLGLLYGPIIIILFLTSLQIYTEHYKY